MSANADRIGIIVLLAAIGLAIVLVVGGLIQEHSADELPDASMCECPCDG